MELSKEVQEALRVLGRAGGLKSSSRMTATERIERAKLANTARWKDHIKKVKHEKKQTISTQ